MFTIYLTILLVFKITIITDLSLIKASNNLKLFLMLINLLF